jgi:NADP-dependent 3-hydroxy acid dehydrogenase YdfG
VGGIGAGLGSALCEKLVENEYKVAGIARDDKILQNLLGKLGNDNFLPIRCDLTNFNEVEAAISSIDYIFGPSSVYIHNAAPKLVIQPFQDTSHEEFESVWRNIYLAAVNGTKGVLPGMLTNKKGTLLFIGATASIKAGANFSAFSSAKFALRGLAQSLARELGPQGIHVSHLLVDGIIWGTWASENFHMNEIDCIQPGSIANICMNLINQDPSAWTHELDIRPCSEKF